MGGKSNRAKGARGERAWARTLTEAGVPAQRGIGQARGGGGEVEDVPAPFLHFEVKARRGGTTAILFSALKQAKDDLEKSQTGKRPCVVYLQNNKPGLAIMEYGTFAEMFAAYVNDAAARAVDPSQGSAGALVEMVSDEDLLREVARRVARGKALQGRRRAAAPSERPNPPTPPNERPTEA